MRYPLFFPKSYFVLKDFAFLCSSENYVNLYAKGLVFFLAVLANAGYRVVAPDMIGFGKSDKYTSVDNYNHEMHMTTVKLLIEVLRIQSQRLRE